MNNKRTFLQYVIPSVLSFALSGVYAIVDGFFVGNSIGDAGLSAIKQYSAGELSNRASQVGVLCKMLASTVLSAGLTSIFSLIYISQISVYAPALVVPR